MFHLIVLKNLIWRFLDMHAMIFALKPDSWTKDSGNKWKIIWLHAFYNIRLTNSDPPNLAEF